MSDLVIGSLLRLYKKNKHSIIAKQTRHYVFKQGDTKISFMDYLYDLIWGFHGMFFKETN